MLPKLTTLWVLTRALKAAATPGGPEPTDLGMGIGLDTSNTPSPRRAMKEHTPINTLTEKGNIIPYRPVKRRKFRFDWQRHGTARSRRRESWEE